MAPSLSFGSGYCESDFGSANVISSSAPGVVMMVFAPRASRRAFSCSTNTSGADAPAVTPMRL